MEQRKYRVDAQVLERLRVQGGWTIEKFCDYCEEKKSRLNLSTLKKLFRGGPVALNTIHLVANVFGITNHLELLHPDELVALGVKPASMLSDKRVQEWEIETYLSDWERTANGLQYCIAKLRHIMLKKRFARGKCYWLRNPKMQERDRLEEKLSRHPDVCQTLRDHPNIAKNITAVSVASGDWWVLDQWEEGRTLAEHLEDKPLAGSRLKAVMTGIAEGLKGLHKESIIRRELSPRFVILRDPDLHPILTDFELAKLLEGKTVAPEDGLRDDDYRAVEAVGGDGRPGQQADIYSWGRVFIEAATGILPAKNKEAEQVAAMLVPNSVKDLVLRCVAKTKSSRPASMDEILKALKRWTP
jgi:serine/threonine protein kinase